jgi:hypothetical protein
MIFSDFEYAGKHKQTRRERFLAEMDQVVPRTGLLELMEPFYPKAGGGRKTLPAGNHAAHPPVAELVLPVVVCAIA